LNQVDRRATVRLAGALTAAALALLPLAGHPAAAQTARTIRIVVPFPAGGSADILARLLGEHIAKNQGTSVVIENRPGGGASIAYEAVARAAPDGNTLVINGNSIVINPHLRKVNYDPLTSFEPVCYLLSSPQVFVVKADAPYKTLAELVAATKAAAGTLVFASVGPATTQHIGFEQFGAAWRSRARGADELFRGGGAAPRRHRPGARVGVVEAHPAAAGRADRP
jgi:tripartite-type tricarboxylate transporter receptor subunit TctC